LFLQPCYKAFENGLAAFGFNADTFGCIADTSFDLVFMCELIDERAEANALDNAADGDFFASVELQL